jgi:hypothetical protein
VPARDVNIFPEGRRLQARRLYPAPWLITSLVVNFVSGLGGGIFVRTYGRYENDKEPTDFVDKYKNGTSSC